MLLREILQGIIGQITSEAGGAKDEDLPVVHARAATIVTTIAFDVLSHQFQDLISKSRTRIDVLQTSTDRNEFVATFKVEGDVLRALAI